MSSEHEHYRKDMANSNEKNMVRNLNLSHPVSTIMRSGNPHSIEWPYLECQFYLCVCGGRIECSSNQ